MSIHFNILIDASGSMGLFKNKDGNVDKNYLLPDGITTRTELVKKVLINSIIPKLSFVDTFEIETFSSPIILNEFGNPKLKAGNKQYSPKLVNAYKGVFNNKIISKAINEIKIPDEAGTPLSWATCVTINQSKHEKINIIILSDGDDSFTKIYDEIILNTIGSKNCKIYFIGISQNEEAQRKSKNLAVKTNGFYVNLHVMNYDEAVFDAMLFEMKSTITSNAIKESLKIEPSIVTEAVVNKIEEKKEAQLFEEEKNDIKTNEEVHEEVHEPIDIKKQVEENTKSLQLISSQLDTIVKQISFIGKNKTGDEDEFEANEGEEINRVIGKKCEVFLFNELVKQFPNLNWLNKETEQFMSYDFDLEFKNQKYYYECKGSVSKSKEFFLTKLEWEFYLNNRNHYRLFVVSDINSDQPTFTRINDLIESMGKGELIPCSSVNRKVKADRILFQILD